MSIIDIKTDKKLLEIQRCVQQRKMALDMIKTMFESTFHSFWNNKIVSPQEHCDFHGNDAHVFFKSSQKLMDFIKYLDPKYKRPKIPREFTINEDGTVTIGEMIED